MAISSTLGSEKMKLISLAFIVLMIVILGFNAGGAPQPNATYDSGFKPDLYSFSFPNYRNLPQVTDLTSAEMQRMFGDKVCRSTADGKCILSPPAKRWMDQANQAMTYGHCEGMAVLSEFIYYNKIGANEFGGNLTRELAFNNSLLQREIAYWWTTQVTSPGSIQRINRSANDVLDTLVKAFEEGRRTTEGCSAYTNQIGQAATV